jgi:hypothetical protein
MPWSIYTTVERFYFGGSWDDLSASRGVHVSEGLAVVPVNAGGSLAGNDSIAASSIGSIGSITGGDGFFTSGRGAASFFGLFCVDDMAKIPSVSIKCAYNAAQ